MRADGVDRGQRPAPCVLVVVDQDPARGPFGDDVLGGDEPRMERLQALGEALCEAPHVLLRRPPLDGDVDVDATGAGRLGEGRHAERLEAVSHDERGLSHARERHLRRSLHRVEVEVDVVGAVHVVAPRVPLVEVDAP